MKPDFQPGIIIEKGGRSIATLDEWLEYAGPKGKERQWVDERSAKELARAWVGSGSGPAMPAALRDLLASHPRFADLVTFRAFPEHRVKLDDFHGETRNVDLLIVAEGPDHRTVISVEAKADEAFDRTIADRLAAADQALEETDGRSKARARVEQLSLALLGRPATEVGALRYQLLQATGAAIAAAADHDADEAVLLVHEFRGKSAKPDLLARNAGDFDAFVGALGEGATAPTGSLAGPFEVPGGGRVVSGVPLYIGKIVSAC